MDSFHVICIAGYIIFILASKLKEKTDELKHKVSPPYGDDFWKYYDILYPDDPYHNNHNNLENFCRSLMSDRVYSIREEYFRKYLDLQNEYLAKEEEM